MEGVISQIKLFNAGSGWRTLTCVHEVRAFRERKKRSVWFRGLVEICVVYGDRGYRGCEGVFVCDSREMRAKRLVVEGVISQIKLFNAGSEFRLPACFWFWHIKEWKGIFKVF